MSEIIVAVYENGVLRAVNPVSISERQASFRNHYRGSRPVVNPNIPILTLETLCSEAAIFSAAESRHPEPLLYGITDGKAVGTYLEQKFRLTTYLAFLMIPFTFLVLMMNKLHPKPLKF